jgi:hypothetical protein
MPPETIEIDDNLPDRVGGYRTLEYLSMCGWSFGIVAGLGGGVLVLGTHEIPPNDQIEIRATGASVEAAVPEIWRQARELRMDFPTSRKRRFAA